MKVSYIYSRIFENLKVAGLQLKTLLKLYCSTILPIFSKPTFFPNALFELLILSRKYGVKPVAHQFPTQENLFLVTFRLPTLIMSESRTILRKG